MEFIDFSMSFSLSHFLYIPFIQLTLFSFIIIVILRLLLLLLLLLLLPIGILIITGTIIVQRSIEHRNLSAPQPAVIDRHPPWLTSPPHIEYYTCTSVHRYLSTSQSNPLHEWNTIPTGTRPAGSRTSQPARTGIKKAQRL